MAKAKRTPKFPMHVSLADPDPREGKKMIRMAWARTDQKLRRGSCQGGPAVRCREGDGVRERHVLHRHQACPKGISGFLLCDGERQSDPSGPARIPKNEVKNDSKEIWKSNRY